MEKLSAGARIDASVINKLIDEIRSITIQGSYGIDVRRMSGGTVLDMKSFQPFLVGKIAGSTIITNYRFKYAFKEVIWNGEEWVDGVKSDYCYNLIEHNNSGTMTGTGVDPTNIPAGFSFEPCPADTIVIIYSIGGRYWFAYENAIDGACA